MISSFTLGLFKNILLNVQNTGGFQVQFLFHLSTVNREYTLNHFKLSRFISSLIENILIFSSILIFFFWLQNSSLLIILFHFFEDSKQAFWKWSIFSWLVFVGCGPSWSHLKSWDIYHSSSSLAGAEHQLLSPNCDKENAFSPVVLNFTTSHSSIYTSSVLPLSPLSSLGLLQVRQDGDETVPQQMSVLHHMSLPKLVSSACSLSPQNGDWAGSPNGGI